jgi:hypothetical protein
LKRGAGPPSNFPSFGKKPLQFLEQAGQLGLNCFPDDLEVDIAVIMNHSVTHAYDFGKWDLRKLGPRLGSEARRRFAGYQEATQNRVLRLGVR